jgi:hypothetical protein
MEGTLCGDGGTSGCAAGVPACNSTAYTLPILEYSHSGGDCSVTGGYVYRGRRFPRLVGTYLYGDYCTGKIWGATNAAGSWSARLFTPRASNLTTFGEDSAGEVYVATESGLFARIVDANPTSPTVASVEAASGSVRGGEAVVLTGSGFLPGVVVTFGGVPGTDVALLDSISTRLSVVAPAHAAGIVDVVVTNSDGRSATVPGGYVFEPIVSVPPRARATRTVAR